MYWQTSLIDFFVLKSFVIGKLSLFSGMQNDALMHREALKGWSRSQPIKSRLANIGLMLG